MSRKVKSALSILLVSIMILSSIQPAFAAESELSETARQTETAAEPIAESTLDESEGLLTGEETETESRTERSTEIQTEPQTESKKESETTEKEDGYQGKQNRASFELNAGINADNSPNPSSINWNDWLLFSGADAGTAAEFDSVTAYYDISADLQNLPANVSGKTVKITLPIGLMWVNDGSKNTDVGAALSGGIASITNADIASYGLSAANTGSKEYRIKNEVTKLTIPFQVQADKRFLSDNLVDGIKIEVYWDNVKQAEISKPIDTSGVDEVVTYYGTTSSSVAVIDEEFDPGQKYGYMLMHKYNGGWVYSYQKYYKEISGIVKTSSKDMVIENAGASKGWQMSKISDTEYKFTVTDYICAGNPVMLPWKVTFPSEDFDDTMTGTVTEGPVALTGWDGQLFSSGNSYVSKFDLVDNTEKVYVQYISNAIAKGKPSNGTWNHDITNAADTDIENLLSSHFYFGNYGGGDSVPKTVELKFDDEVVGVTGIRLGVPKEKTATNIRYQVKGDLTWHTAAVTALTGDGSNGAWISNVSMGADRRDYIAALQYDLETVPKGSHFSISTYGSILQETNTNETYATIEIKDQDPAGTITTGLGRVQGKMPGTNKGADRYGTVSVNTKSSAAINAGSKASFSITWYGNMKNPVLWVRSEGGYPIKSIKLENGGNALSDQIPDEDITSYTASDGAMIYRIDTKALTGADAAITGYDLDADGNMRYARMNLSFDMDIPVTALTGTYQFNDMFFIENPNDTNSSSSIGYVRGGQNPFSFPISGKLGGVNQNPGNYSIVENRDILVSNAVRHANSASEAWWTWEEGSSDYLFTGEGSDFEFRVSINNNSGAEVGAGTVVYQPVPKEGENWGILSNNTSFLWGAELKQPFQNPDSAKYEVYYGIVTPTTGKDLGNAFASLAGETWEAWDGNKKADYNAIKIVVKQNMPATGNNVANFDGVLTTSYLNEKGSGIVNIWSGIYDRSIINGNGHSKGGITQGFPVAVAVENGRIKGTLWNDANGNGLMDSGESAITESGWQVKVIRIADDVVEQIVNVDPATGTYQINDLSQSPGRYYLEVANQKQPAGFYFTKTVTAETGNHFIGNADHSIGTVSEAVPKESPDAGIYNIGLTQYAYTVTFKTSVLAADGTATAGTSTGGTFSYDGVNDLTTKQVTGKGIDGVTIKSDTITATAKSGYEFLGWYDNKEGNGSKITALPAAVGYEDVTYYAVFGPDLAGYTVEYYYMGTDGTYPVAASTSDTTRTAQTGTAVQITTADKIPDTVSYPGRELDADAAGDWSGTVAADGGLKLKVYFKLSSYTLFYVTNTTKPAAIAADKVAYGAKIAEAAGYQAHDEADEIIKDGYSFNGWFTKDGTGGDWGSMILATDTMPAADKTIYAKWTARNYTIKYDLNGGTGSGVADQTAAYDTDVIISGFGTNTPPADKQFVGWNVSADGNGISYSANTAYRNLITPTDTLDEITLFAVYTDRENVVLTYLSENTEKGTVDPAQQAVKPASGTVAIPVGGTLGSVALPKSGYMFSHWTDETNSRVGDAATYLPAKDALKNEYVTATYTAHFEKRDEIGSKGQIGANNFFYGVRDELGNVSPLIDEQKAKELAKTFVSGYVHGTTIAQSLANATADTDELDAINDKITAGIKGIFDLTFYTEDYNESAGTGDKVTIKVTLTGVGNAQIGATDFIYGVKKPGGSGTINDNLTEAVAKELGYAWAKDSDGIFYQNNITADAAQLKVINEAKHDWFAEGAAYDGPTVFDLTFTSKEAKTITVKVTLFSSEETGGKEKLAANDFTYDIINGEISAGNSKVYGEAFWSDVYGNAKDIAPVIPDSAQLKAINDKIKAGVLVTYPLTFRTPDGLETTINVTLIATIVKAEDQIHYIQDGVLSAEKVKEIMRASAKDPHGNVIKVSDLRLGAGELGRINQMIGERTEGVVDVTFSAPDGTKTTAKLTLLLRRASVKITKVDADTGAALAGAKLAVLDAAGNEVLTWTSTTEVYAQTDVLIAGDTYILKEQEAPSGYLLASDMPFTAKSDGSSISLTMQDKKAAEAEGKSTTVKVTKYVMYDSKLYASNLSFYAALFFDPDCTQRATEVKELKMNGSYTSAVQWKGLPAGTYYLAETDADGTKLDFENQMFTNEIDGQVIELKEADSSASAVIFNHIKEEGRGSLYENDGHITIKKTVVDGKEAKKVKDTFYFALFSEAELEHAVYINSLKLKNASAGSITFDGLARGTYYVAETDKNGNPVDSSFAYSVSVDNEQVTIAGANESQTVNIVNDADKGDSTETNKPDGTKKPGVITKTTTRIVTAKGVKTGDSNRVMPYILLLVGAAGLSLASMRYKKRRRVKC